jgi:hypothetical protein
LETKKRQANNRWEGIAIELASFFVAEASERLSVRPAKERRRTSELANRISDLLNPMWRVQSKKGRFSEDFCGSAVSRFPHFTVFQRVFHRFYCPYCPVGEWLKSRQKISRI